jgi:UDP-3-O-[3-hydroxymyristoyl] glucosamine N-acyltransferase
VKKRKGARSRGRSSGPTPAVGFFTLEQVAAAVGGRVAGDPKLRLTGVQPLERATAQDLSWVAGVGPARRAGKSGAGAFLVSHEADSHGRPAVLVDQPALALAVWLALRYPPTRPKAGIARGANVHRTARLGRGVHIAPGATVAARASVGAGTVLCAGAFVGEGASVGEDSYLHPHSVVLERCRVGSRCVLHPGAVVGSDGFGFVWDGRAHRKIPQVGIVRIEDDVEIGANATIDRATLGETVIARGTKIDNLVQVGHNVVVGEDAILCAQTGIAGSARLGNRVTLAGQVGVSDHASIPDGVTATGQAGVLAGAGISPGEVVSGMPAAPHREFLKRSAWIARLPELARRVEKLEKQAGRPSKGD